jgi:hypothetical protein
MSFLINRRHSPNRNIENKPVLDEYLTTYRHDLSLGQKIALNNIESMHCRLECSLHRDAGSSSLHLEAFLYSTQRLPDCMFQVNRVLLGSNEDTFVQAGYGNPSTWPLVTARARRRKIHYDGRDVLAMFLTSVSDLDDVIPVLCAYQIEWNKMHRLLSQSEVGWTLQSDLLDPDKTSKHIRRALGLVHQDWRMLTQLWGHDWERKIKAVVRAPKNIEVDRLPLNAADFEATAAEWWDRVLERFSDLNLAGRPVYLMSGNNHSLANIISGYARKRQNDIERFMDSHHDDALRKYWRDARFEPTGVRMNLFYYGQKYFIEGDAARQAERTAMEEAGGLTRYLPPSFPRLEVQVLDLARVDSSRLDPRLNPGAAGPRAVVINLDYPLGDAAQYILRCALRRLPELRGVYILGKSAAMIGRLGDMLIPRLVYDDHTQKTFVIDNALALRDVLKFIERIAVFDDQRSITVKGTFLHSWKTVQHLHKDDYTGIEMEAGPYLAAIYKHFHGPLPEERLVTIKPPLKLDIGLLHYTSDTPYNVRASLLSRRLGLAGLEATYAGSLAILNRIFYREATG